ncbi:MAG: outer membrane beta-barrel domain-containing protein [Myxococcales bacterium]|nr:outer membrane beta-barrel domain-containing protein [Myxococcales bacterium]
MSNYRILLATVALLAASFASTSAFAKDTAIDHELEKYWNVELAVPTVTNPAFSRKGAFEAMVGLGVVPNDSYYLPLPLTLRGAYHMTNNVAVEASFSYMGLGPESDLHDFLKTAGKQGLLLGVRKPTKTNLAVAVDLVYSPFHGKLGVFDKKISSFDIAMAVGAGMIGASVDTNPAEEGALEDKFLPAGHWGLTLRFFAKEWLTVRADYRQFAYKPLDTVLFPVEMTLGVSFFSK